MYREIVLKIVCSGVVKENSNRVLYYGATYDDNINGMYSFVPAIKDEGKKGFPRIFMPDDFYDVRNNAINKYFSKWSRKNGAIYEGKNTGIKKENNVNINEIKHFWEYLKDIISRKCVLRFNFEIPVC